MSDFWTALAAAGRNDGVQPRLTSRFEQMETLSEADAPLEPVADRPLSRAIARDSAGHHSAESSSPRQPIAMPPQFSPTSPTPPATRTGLTAERPQQNAPGTAPVLQPFATIRPEIRREIRRELPVVQPVTQTSVVSPALHRTVVERPATQDVGSPQPAQSPEQPAAVPILPVVTTQQTVSIKQSAEPVQKPARPRRDRVSAETTPIQPAVTLEPLAAPQQRQSAESTIRVTIGRIEIRANTPQPQVQNSQPQPRFQPALTLDDYLKQRNGGGQ